MLDRTTITAEYFREYRQKLGFSNQNDTKGFFGAKDIVPSIDFEYIGMLNVRLSEIVDKINEIVADEVKVGNLVEFKKKYIDQSFKTIQTSDILPVLNNQGRRPEEVYFSWMRGFVVSNFFLKTIGLIFAVDVDKISVIGDDDLRSIETFRRTPKADIEIDVSPSKKLRVEVQSGFTGTNDIKQHKVLEARRVSEELGISSVAMHLDLFNGQAAFVQLDKIEEGDVHWITRQQMEGQTVFNIDQNYFVWKITDAPVKWRDIPFN